MQGLTNGVAAALLEVQLILNLLNINNLLFQIVDTVDEVSYNTKYIQ